MSDSTNTKPAPIDSTSTAIAGLTPEQKQIQELKKQLIEQSKQAGMTEEERGEFARALAFVSKHNGDKKNLKTWAKNIFGAWRARKAEQKKQGKAGESA